MIKVFSVEQDRLKPFFNTVAIISLQSLSATKEKEQSSKASKVPKITRIRLQVDHLGFICDKIIINLNQNS